MIAPQNIAERGTDDAAQKTATPPTWDQLLQVPRSEIPAVVGELEWVKTTLLARLVEPDSRSREADEDPLLTADQVAETLQVDRKWVYRHKDKLGGMALSRKKLRFPSSEVERYLRRRKAASQRGRQ